MFFSLKIQAKPPFALSLPRKCNYFKAGCSLQDWQNDAAYIVIDDVPWDKFEEQYLPEEKALLTCDKPAYVSGSFVSKI